MQTVKIKLLINTIYDLEVHQAGEVLSVDKEFARYSVAMKQSEYVKETNAGDEVTLNNRATTEISKQEVKTTNRKKGK